MLAISWMGLAFVAGYVIGSTNGQRKAWKCVCEILSLTNASSPAPTIPPQST